MTTRILHKRMEEWIIILKNAFQKVMSIFIVSKAGGIVKELTSQLEAKNQEIEQLTSLLEPRTQDVKNLQGEKEDLFSKCGDLFDDLQRTNEKLGSSQLALKALVINLTNGSLMSSEEIYTVAGSRLDEGGWKLLKAAESILGKFSYSSFAYEDNTGVFDRDSCDGHELLRWLEGSRFNGFTYDIVPGTCYEKSTWLGIDKENPDYIDYRKELHEKVIDMIFNVDERDRGAA